MTRLHAGLRNLGLILGRDRYFTLIRSANIGRLAHAMFYQWMPKALSPGIGLKRNRRLYILGRWWVGLFGTGPSAYQIGTHWHRCRKGNSRSHPHSCRSFSSHRKRTWAFVDSQLIFVGGWEMPKAKSAKGLHCLLLTHLDGVVCKLVQTRVYFSSIECR